MSDASPPTGRIRRAADRARHIELAAHLADHPGDAEAWRRLGVVLARLDRVEDAVTAYRRALAIAPALPQLQGNLGNALVRLGNADAAIRAHRAEVARDPAVAESWFNLGAALLAADRLEQAREAFDAAIERSQGRAAPAHANLGSVLVRQNRLDEAVAAYRRAIALQPGLATAHYNLALCLLAQGRFAEGWAEYEWRWRHVPALSRRPAHPAAPWQGEDPAGLTLLVHAEQGLGDTIQFARYLPLLARRGARVLFAVPAPLIRLMWRLDGVAAVVAEDGPLPAVDRIVPIQSLPCLMAGWLRGIPADVPYLAAADMSPAKPAPGPSIGLVWAGSPGHRNDRRRSLHFAALAPVLAVPGCRFVSLQTGPAAAQLKESPAPAPQDRGSTLRDFATTADALGEIDLLITVDTAAAHLAGALGRRAWVLLPFAPDWRWGLGRSDSPWYPSLTLYRQPRPGDWASVIARVAADLAAGAFRTSAPPRAPRPASA